MSAVSIRFGRRDRLGRRGVCPFCGYIGPPLLCGCVTEMHNALHTLLRGHLDRDGVANADAVLDRHEERVRILNEELQRTREA